MTDATSATADGGNGALQVLMMGLGEETLAIEASLVREILDPILATRVPGAKAYLPSVINVRGNVVPLADIRLRFGMPCRPATADTRIVVVELVLGGDAVIVGIMADKVYEVTEIQTTSMQSTPRVGLHWKPEYIRCMAKWNEDFIIVPDMERIFN